MALKLFGAAMVTFLVGASSFAACVAENEPITVEGIAMSRATYIDPADFGWAPANGFESYNVIVLQSPICIRSTSPESGRASDTYARILQVGGLPALREEDLKRGVPVSITGKAFPAETAHHFEDLVLIADSVTFRSDR